MANWKAGLLATDISNRALNIAKEGLYDADSVKPMPPGLRNKYFKKRPDGDMEVIPQLKREVIYRKFNLMNNLPFRKPFHVVLCRNVMIYFDGPTKINLVNKIYNHMVPGGYLFIGHSETLPRDKTPFKYVCPAVYKK